MAVNKHRSHVWVVPVDDANRQLANGFCKHWALKGNCIDVLDVSGGWHKVLEDFEQVHVKKLHALPLRHLILLIDFDGKVDDRTEKVKKMIPADLENRVFLLGSHGEPEALRKAIGQSLEKLGEILAAECASDATGLWAHDLLKHNENELARLRIAVKPFLFN